MSTTDHHPLAIERRRLLKTAAAASAAVGCGAALSACDGVATARVATARELTAGMEPAAPSSTVDETLDEGHVAQASALALSLLARCAQDDAAEDPHANTFISPLSITFALALVQNGAAGETLAQLEQLTGMTTDELNDYLETWRTKLSAADDEVHLHIANSIWMKDTPTLSVEDAYLDACATHLGAEAYAALFDQTTIDDVNAWVSEHTAGMIDRLVERLDDSARLLLLNALAFEAPWDEPFEEGGGAEDTFTCEDGTETQVHMMLSYEDSYLEDDRFIGFVRPYQGWRHAFVGLLPREGVALDEALAALDGDRLHALLRPVDNARAFIELPRFTLEYGTSLVETLRALGVTDAFDTDRADFSAMGSDDEGPLYLGEVLHKTFLEVDEAGTRAAAATAGIMAGASAPMDEPVVHEVFLNRPFVCLIVDLDSGAPIFAGAVRYLGEG